MAIHIKELVSEFLKQEQGKFKQKEAMQTAISKVLPTEIKNHIALKKITSNGIVFSSDSSGAGYNLKLIKEKLLTEIQKEFPNIKKITVQMGRQ